MNTLEQQRVAHALPNVEEQRVFIDKGYDVDEQGRPLHPWVDRRNTLPDGKDTFYHWGPNYTVDPIVMTDEENPSILLVRRQDNGLMALPGGFVDGNESASQAAGRELMEETGLVAPNASPISIYSGPVDDYRSTRHTWPETTAMLWCIPTQQVVEGGDDAKEATWVRLSDLRGDIALHGSHATLIDMAIRQHGTALQKLDYFGDASEHVRPKGGHMGYDRTVVTLPTGERIFVKAHDPEHFSDGTREQHSRAYLEREYTVYQSLLEQYPHVPHDVQLHQDVLLTMEAFDERDGWHWRLPDDIGLRHRYVTDILDALERMESVTVTTSSLLPSSYNEIARASWPEVTKLRPAIEALLSSSPIAGARDLLVSLDDYIEHATPGHSVTMDSFAHFDIRQSNVAWHPELGTKVIDWSWADIGPRLFDSTSFLIDTAKAGFDITPYRGEFSQDHASLLIGFWLVRSIQPNIHGTDVREQQLASAIAAHRLCQEPFTTETKNPLPSRTAS